MQVCQECVQAKPNTFMMQEKEKKKNLNKITTNKSVFVVAKSKILFRLGIDM